jgi:triosephosphate isomerase
MRIPLIAGNWKMFKKTDDALQTVDDLLRLVDGVEGVEVVVAPSFTLLKSVSQAVAGSRVSVAGQDCYWEDEGAFTGEVSPGMLVDAGCSHVIIGHSERRQYFGETDETVNRKLKSALRAGLAAMVCIGETLEEREAGDTFKVLERQVEGGLSGISISEMGNVVIAYEPVWAIGTGRTASDDQAQEAHAFIRGLVAKLFPSPVAENTRILYGGSVKPGNIAGLMSRPDIDGALVGGASLDAESFAAVIRFRK